MTQSDTNVDRLLKARSQIDAELRRLKASMTVLFTDVVGSTAYFDRYGDTAGVAMLGRHAEEVGAIVRRFEGRVVKNIGDSVMAEFPRARVGVQAAAEIQRRQVEINRAGPAHERFQVRIGLNSGVGFRKDNDVYGDVVNLAARLTKRSGPAQILVSKVVITGAQNIEGVEYAHLGKVTVEGRSEKDDLYEVVWTSPSEYAEIRREVSVALVRGEIAPRPLYTPQHYASPFPTPALGRPGGLFETPPPAPDELTARYDLLEELGRGGMGIVYKARDRETGDLVALKLLKPEIAADQAVMDRFKNELRLARKITHKNVCRIYEFNRAGGTAFISMEYVEGESLRAALGRFGTLSLRKAVEIAGQICSGLEEAHGQGVVHRDLKPENVMVDSAGQVKIMDFGIARSLTATLTQTGSTLGTPAYMAPEQAEGRKVDGRTDIYALGLVLFEMVTGRQAFKGDTAAQIAYKQVHELPALLRELDPALPAELEQIVSRCLAKHPEDRFGTVEALGAVLEGVGDPGKATPPEASYSLEPETDDTVTIAIPRGWKLTLASAAAISATAGLIAWGVWFFSLPESVESQAANIPVLQPQAEIEDPLPPAEIPAEESAAEPEPPAREAAPVEVVEPVRASRGPGRTPVSLAPRESRRPVPKREPSSTFPIVRKSEPDPPLVTRDAALLSPPLEIDSDTTETVKPPGEQPVIPAGEESVSASEIEPNEPDSAIEPAARGIASLEVRSFKREREAYRLRDRLEKNGFPAHIISYEEGTAHRVVVGPFDSLEVARAAQRRLQALGHNPILQIGDQ